MSEKYEVVEERLGGHGFRFYKSALVEGGVYIEFPGNDAVNGCTFNVEELLLALHNLGFDIQGWEPKKTLQEQVTDLLRATTSMVHPERAEKIIELVQGFKP